MLEYFTNVTSAVIPNNGILVVGDGNFSFSRDLSNYTKNIKLFMTSFDSQEVVYADQNAYTNVQFLLDQPNVYVKHSVDATNLLSHFPDHKFALIIFNFPHIGGKSNIRKCRKLLQDFFASSCLCLCDGGKILVSLCRGQGGTPRDHFRQAYGNTWQAASQASKAGLILIELIDFDASTLAYYQQAGYRSKIKNGFLTNGSLLHIFSKGNLHNSLHRCLNSDSLKDSSFVDPELFHHKNNESMKNLHKDNPYMIKLQHICSKSLETFLKEIDIEKGEQFYKEMRYLSNSLYDITPYTNSTDHILIYDFNLKTCNRSFNELRDELCKHLLFFFCGFDVQIKEDCCYGDVSLDKDSPLCSKIHPDKPCKYNVDFTPNFVEEVSCDVWRKYQPEITLSYAVKSEACEHQVFYKTILCKDYQLTDIEKHYLATKIKYTTVSGYKLFIDDFCVVSIQNMCSENVVHLLMKFHLNEIFLACYKVSDLRYLWSEDDVIFKTNLLDHMSSDEELHTLTRPSSAFNTQIQHPLCYRHDLCLWLDDQHDENDLFTIIKSNSFGCIHGVFLLRVLFYEETSLVSYCYRMIYSRVDGPLSHLETVKLQNNIRKKLLKAGFKLR